MTTVEWVEEKDWSKVKVGQRVRLEHENGDVVEVEVRVPDDAGGFASAFNFYSVSAGWTLYVTPPPTPELPTEPGVYADKDGDAWLRTPMDGMVLLSEDGSATGVYQPIHPAEFGPFTRLAPVPDTAQKVLEELREILLNNNIDGNRVVAWLAEVAEEFGVTE